MAGVDGAKGARSGGGLSDDGFLAWCESKGIAQDAALSVKEAAKVGDVGERTLRRYIADGKLSTLKVTGPRGDEHRIMADVLYGLIGGRRGVLDRAQAPADKMAKELEQLRKIVEAQSRMIDDLRAEVHDSRAQLSQFQDQVIRALPAPSKRSSWWPFGRRS